MLRWLRGRCGNYLFDSHPAMTPSRFSLNIVFCIPQDTENGRTRRFLDISICCTLHVSSISSCDQAAYSELLIPFMASKVKICLVAKQQQELTTMVIGTAKLHPKPV